MIWSWWLEAGAQGISLNLLNGPKIYALTFLYFFLLLKTLPLSEYLLSKPKLYFTSKEMLGFLYNLCKLC